MRNFVSANRDSNRDVGASTAREQFAPAPADYVEAAVLPANVDGLHAIPDGAKFVSFSATGDFYASFGDENVVAAVPSASIEDGTASVLNPGMRRIPEGVTFISVIAPADCVVTLEFWAE